MLRRRSGFRAPAIALAIAASAMTLLLAPSAMSGGRAAGTDTYFGGMLHHPLGSANLAITDGSLSISNIGSSGQDGVSVDLGQAQGWSTRLVVASAGVLRCDSMVAKMGRVQLAAAGARTSFTQEFGLMLTRLGPGSGVMSITAYLQSFQLLGGTVELRLAGAPVDSVTFTSLLPLEFARVQLGSTGSEGVEFRGEAEAPDLGCAHADGRYILRPGVPISMNISGHASVLADECVVTYRLNDGNNQNWLFGEGTLLARAPSGQPPTSIVDLETRLKALGLLLRSTGQSHITAVVDQDIDQPDMAMSNIGSSGQDGVSIDLGQAHLKSVPGNIGINQPIPDTSLHCAAPVSLGLRGQALSLRGVGAVAGPGGVPGQELCRASWGNQLGVLHCNALFSAMGGTQVQVEVWDAGAPVGSAVVSDAGEVATLSALAGGTLPKISDFGMSRVSGPPLVDGAPPVLLSFRFDSPGRFQTATSLPMEGDEMRIVPHNPSHGVASLSSLDMAGRSLAPLTLSRADVTVLPQGSIEHFGVQNIPLLGSISVGLAGELQCTAPPGSAAPYGVVIPLGAAQGSMVEFDFPFSSASLLPIVNRAVLKGYLERGDHPTQSQFGDVIDSFLNFEDDGVTRMGVSTSGFSPTQVRCTARLAGHTVASVTLPAPWPQALALSDGFGSAGGHGVILSTFAQDIDGNGGLDRVVCVYRNPVATDVTLTGSALATVTADEVIFTLTGFDLGHLQASAASVTCEGASSFTVRGVEVVNDDNPHAALGAARIDVPTCDDGSSEPTSIVMDNLGSSGQDGVRIYVPVVPAGSGPGVGPPLAFTLDGSRSSDDEVVKTWTWRQVGGPVVGMVDEISSMQMTSSGPPSGGRVISLAPMPWLEFMSIRTRTYLHGALTGEVTGQPPGALASTFVPDVPGQYQFQLVVTSGSNLANTSPSGVLHKVVWNTTIDISLPGVGTVSADTLEVLAQRGATGTPVEMTLTGMDVLVAGWGGGGGGSASVRLGSEGVVRQNTCPADIMPIGAPDGAVNVSDLLAVIGTWGPCVGCATAHCPADIFPVGPPQGDCQINVSDLLAVIGTWGACP